VVAVIATALGFVTSNFGKVLALLGLLAMLSGIAIWLVKNLEGAGAAKVEAAVEHATNTAVENARKDKEAADEKVRISPADAVIDSTR
jgi:hypothetical protein